MGKLLFTAVFTIGGLSLCAQNKSESAPGLVPVQTVITVEARHDHDRDVPSLRRDDVMAYERKARLPVTDLVSFQGENAGLELFVLIDDGSNTVLGTEFGDLRHFIETQPATIAIGIGYMRNGTVDIVQNFTDDRSHAAKALRLPLSGGVMASPYLSLTDLIKRWPGNSNRREVVMVTSGIDPLGGMGSLNPYLDSAIEAAQRNGIVVYAIYTPGAGHAGHNFWRLNWAQNHLAQLSEETGGESYMLGFGAPVSFAPYLDEITARLAHQYKVTYLMKAENKGAFRAVRFATEVPNAELVAPSKVYVPSAHEPSANRPVPDE